MGRSSRSWVVVTAALLSVAGCRCTPIVTQTEPARVVARPARLLLPATYVGQQSAAGVELTNQGGQTAALELAIDPPFTVATAALTLARGQSEPVRVTFVPDTVGPVARILHVGELEIEVEAEGLAVPQCIAPTACLSSSFDFAAAECRESVLADGTACETSCVLGGCAQGVCLGQLKGCDDADACTLDGCSETNGCAHLPRVCPAPTSPCQVARCDSASGCGLEDVPDGTLCGPDDCKALQLDVCVTGQCVRRPRPATGRCANRWVPVSISRRGAHAMAWDAARQRLILFGGGPRVLGDTWEWDGQRWSLRTPAASPPARSHHAMAYDAVRQRIVLFGGTDELNLPLSDTWEWDGVTWVQRAPALSPSARGDHAMVYDLARKRIVLFGGAGAGGYLGDTWEWDGASWVLRAPAVSPSARYLHELAYDAARQRVLLFGGYDTTIRGDTWEWDGATWSQRSPARSPEARAYHALAYDPVRQRVVFFGGAVDGMSTYQDTWEWDGTTWSPRPTVRYPPSRGQHAMAYDPVRQRVVLFGGFEVHGYAGAGRADTWEWDGTAWTQHAIVPSPSPRFYQAMAFDPVRRRVVLFGGEGQGGAFADLWEWDGAAWLERRPLAAPDSRMMHALSWDPVRQRVVMFGGFGGNSGVPRYSDLWEWDGASWTERMPAAAPPARGQPLMAYDSPRQQLVLFGGHDTTTSLADTWLWDGTSWAERFPMSAPPANDGAAMTYDEARQRAVLFGGNGSAQTWTWDGTDWQLRTPASSPTARGGHALAYDSVRQRVLLFGGFQMPTLFGDTWEWDGVSWLQRAPVSSPPGSYGHSMAYDAARERLVLFQEGDTWLFLP